MIKKIGHILLVTLLLGSTTGITLHKHYCMGRLKTVAVFEHADSCMKSMGLEEMECPKSCCDDKEQELKVNDLVKTTFDIDLSPKLNLYAYSTIWLDDVQDFYASNHPTYYQYKPPLLSKDVPVMVQSFLL